MAIFNNSKKGNAQHIPAFSNAEPIFSKKCIVALGSADKLNDKKLNYIKNI